ncbi:MAG: translation initiation factor IF-3 [Candidatus Omnitrophica bacterium]|nr:translation initiation factor IF-3 [Candidatus Omnitrophota bacterium]
MRVNERIRINQIRVIADDGSQLGVMTPPAALALARERGLDLVEVAPLATPPVCRIMDYNKFRYEQDKRDREAKRKHHIARLKEIKFKPHIEAHDYQVKLQQLTRFLMRGDKVKVTMVYRGRELSHLDLGRRILDRLNTDLLNVARVERDPLLEGRFMSMIYAPDPAALKRIAKQQRATAKAAPAVTQPAAPEQPANERGAI